MPVSFKNELIFIHIPKNAGTAITLNKEMSFIDIGHHTFEYYKTLYPNAWTNFKKVAVVRNPWDRFVSNYEYSKMEKSFWHSSDGSTPESVHFDFNTTKNLTFEETVNLYYNDRSSLRHQGWSNQYPYIVDINDERKIVTTHLFYYENLKNNQNFNNLFPNLDKVNESTKSSSDYKTYYNEDTIRKVGEIYKEDIDLFNFKF